MVWACPRGLSPTFIGSISDKNGRRPAYMICFVIYLGANIGLTLQDSYPALVVLRFLQSSGSSGTIALGSAVVADIITRAQRGKYIGYASMGVTLGPCTWTNHRRPSQPISRMAINLLVPHYLRWLNDAINDPLLPGNEPQRGWKRLCAALKVECVGIGHDPPSGAFKRPTFLLNPKQWHIAFIALTHWTRSGLLFRKKRV